MAAGQNVTMSLMDSLGFIEERVILHLLGAVTVFVGLIVFLLLQYMEAFYGRYHTSSPQRFRLLWIGVNSRLAWFLQEIPGFILPSCITIYYIFNEKNPSLLKILLASLFTLHYFQRSTIYPFMLRGGKPTPWFLWFLAFVYVSVHGYAQTRGVLVLGNYNNNFLENTRIIIGVLLFFIGMGINIHSDSILRNLRKPGEVGYKIPRGGMFEYVSAANFFGEIVEWIGFAIATKTTTAFSFAFFTIANIGPRGLQHHKWYLEKFDDYPVSRKALVPFIL